MANSIPFRTTPQLGPQLNAVITPPAFYDATTMTEPSYRLGNKEVGNDGHDYVWVRASAAIAATATTGTQVTITEPAFTAATGAGGYFTPPGVAVPSGACFHARKGAAGAP